MKTLASIGLSAAVVFSAFGQRVLVNFYPANQPYSGLTNYPQQTLPVTWSTNSPGWNTNMSTAEFVAYWNALLPTYRAAESNALAAVASGVTSNYLAWASLYAKLPVGEADSLTRSNSMYTVYQSILANTNSAAQDHARLVTMAQSVWISYIYLNQILEYLDRLGPGLQRVYNPEQDPVGH